MKSNPRWVIPLIGVVLSVLAYLAQNVWQILHVEDVTRAIRGLGHQGVALGFLLIGVVEGTILICLYLPGTAVMILLWLSLQPSLAEEVQFMTWLMAGTLVGYAISLGLGMVLGERFPSLVGRTYFHRVQSFIARFGLLGVGPAAFHPNHLALVFAVLGYFRARRLWLYFFVAGVAQAAWWSLYLSIADLILRQSPVTSTNFQLYLAALFSVWLVYELLSRRQA